MASAMIDIGKFGRMVLLFGALVAPLGEAVAESFLCREPNGRVTSRVIGGNDLSHDEAPYQVLLRLGPHGSSICGGSIISRNFVLTAAHCLYDRFGRRYAPEEIVVHYGAADLSHAKRAGVRRVTVHPGHDPRRTVGPNDIAVLRIDGRLDVSRTAVLQIASRRLDRGLLAPGTCARVSGFGDTGSGRPSRRLQGAHVPIRRLEECRAFRDEFGAGMLCAGFRAGGHDSCHGDSGGPLVIREGPTGWLQVGVVSWGLGTCGVAGGFGVYTRIGEFADWILEATKR